MKLRCIVSLLFSMLYAGMLYAGDENPKTVQIEGMGEMLELLKRIDQGVARLAASRWEYRIVQRNRLENDLFEKISALGKDGWELVNATVQEGFIFKRRVK